MLLGEMYCLLLEMYSKKKCIPNFESIEVLVGFDICLRALKKLNQRCNVFCKNTDLSKTAQSCRFLSS